MAILRGMRYVIYGAGGVGGAIGARLFQRGREVVLIARGPHLEAVQRDGLTLRTPDEAVTLRIRAVGHPSEITFGPEDAVLLTVKSQDTAAALDELRAALRPGSGRPFETPVPGSSGRPFETLATASSSGRADELPVICAQNGVANERMALRRFSRVYAMMVMLPATHLQPGEVIMHTSTALSTGAAPVGGILDAGCYPAGVDPLVEQVVRDMGEAGFDSRADAKVTRIKYAKLIENLANAVQALCGLDAAAGELVRAVRAEGVACLQAAGIDFASEREMDERRAEVMRGLRPIEGQARGGSTWQSLARGAGSIETDYLNGEIALLGALNGVPTPYNRLLQRLAAEAAREGRPPGTYTAEELMEMVRERMPG